MSIYYGTCECCGYTYHDEYVGKCEECGHSLCTGCLVNKGDLTSRYAYDYNVKYDGTKEQIEKYGIDGVDYGIGEVLCDGDIGIDSKYCPYCNGLKAHPTDLLNYAMKQLHINLADFAEEYKREVKNGNINNK